MEVINVAGVIVSIVIWVVIWKTLPALIGRVGMVMEKLLPHYEEKKRSDPVSKRLIISREGIFRTAAIIIVGMVIYMPTHVRVGGNFMTDFAYRFVWQLGKDPSGWPIIEPAMSILLGQVVVVVVIAALLAATLPSKKG